MSAADTADSDRSYGTLRAAVVILSLVGLSLALVALWEHVVYSHRLATGPSFCNISARFNCEAVNASAWSRILGIPVASYGIFFFALLLLVAVCADNKGVITSRAFAGFVLLSGTVASIGSLILLGISEFVIGSLCLICIAMYIVNFAVTAAALVWSGGDSVSARARAAFGLGVDLLSGFFGKAVRQSSPIFSWVFLGLVSGLVLVISQLPGVIYDVASKRLPKPQKEEDPVVAWRRSEEVQIKNRTDGTAFSDFTKGPSNAPIKIVEFADFECPACRRLYQSMKPWLHHFEGQYQLTFRNYPLDNSCNPNISKPFHKAACTAAFFSRCAAEQGKFWEAVDFLFAYEGLEMAVGGPGPQEGIISEGSRQLQLDEEGIRSCIASGRYKEKILEDIEEGNRIGLRATPTIWVNGREARARPLDDLEKVFREILTPK